MDPASERYYLIEVIRELLSLCENKRGKDNKEIIAATIMYVVGQYPSFLKSNWKFHRTVINKLNEFMHEKHPGVQDMACETYLVIAKESKEELSKQHEENSPYIDTVINTLQTEIKELEVKYKEITGQDMVKCYRPPQGKYNDSTLAMAKELGYSTYFWSLAYVDWYQDKQPTKDEAFEKLIGRIHPGAIVLLHSTSSTNAEILDELLTKWSEMGYTIEPLTELIENQKVEQKAQPMT